MTTKTVPGEPKAQKPKPGSEPDAKDDLKSLPMPANVPTGKCLILGQPR